MFPFSEATDSADFISTLNLALSVADEWTKKVNTMNDEAMQYRSKCLHNLINGVEENQSQTFVGTYNFMHL
jgi:hypothetical protein